MTDVLNLATGARIGYSLPPREAVIAAYAQGLGDWNTWDYTRRYSSMVDTFTVDARTYHTLGDMTAMEVRA